jgi:hypothetical protein
VTSEDGMKTRQCWSVEDDADEDDMLQRGGQRARGETCMHVELGTKSTRVMRQ